MRMLLGLTRPSLGTATIDGRPYAELPHPLRSVGALVDPNMFHPRRTGRNALRVIARAADIPDRRVDHVLALVGLTGAAHRRAGKYSTGMRQRLALAAALLGDPGTLVLDEPANGLDPEGVHWLRGLIKTLAAEGRTVFVSSHLLAELAQTIDDVAIIGHGRLITHQPMAELLAHAGDASLEDVYLQLTQAAQPPTHSPLKERL
jgi:ABC-2 type transport system ATP-binding protein